MRLERVILTVALAFASSGASAQSFERFSLDIGHLGQPRRAEIRDEEPIGCRRRQVEREAAVRPDRAVERLPARVHRHDARHVERCN